LSVDVERGDIAGLECMGSSPDNLLKIPADYFPPIHCPISKDAKYRLTFGCTSKSSDISGRPKPEHLVRTEITPAEARKRTLPASQHTRLPFLRPWSRAPILSHAFTITSPPLICANLQAQHHTFRTPCLAAPQLRTKKRNRSVHPAATTIQP
jgi:hypothetical protein